MKKVIGYVISWIAHGIGHVISYGLHYDSLSHYLFYPYSWFMDISSDIEKWAGIEYNWKHEESDE